MAKKGEPLPCPSCASWDVGIFKELPTLVSYFCFGCGHRFDVTREPPKKKAPKKTEGQ